MRIGTIPEPMAFIKTTTTTTQTRFEICVTDQQGEELGALAEELGLNQPQTLKNALLLYLHVHKAEKEGGQVVIKRPGKPDEHLLGF